MTFKMNDDSGPTQVINVARKTNKYCVNNGQSDGRDVVSDATT